MAEQNGFFQAVWDDELINPETGLAGDYDLKYYANQFADYFGLFVGNGVFASPVNQLKVSFDSGMDIVVNTGWAFIKGYWYHLDEELTLTVPSNSNNYARTDSVMLRLDLSNRNVKTLYMSDTIQPTRTDTIYDLKLAEVIVQPNAQSIFVGDITDTRSNENVCGFVKGLVEVVDTEDLFEQYNAIFNEWFDAVKDQVTGDLAIRLQLEFDALDQKVDTYQDNVQGYISTYENNLSQQIAGYNANYQQTLDASQQLINDYVNKDYVTSTKTLTFTNKVCTISDSKVTSDSLIDVYFTADTITHAEDCKIVVDSLQGQIQLTAEVQPTQTIKAKFRVRVS